MPRFTGVRYVVPLREGGSLPAVVDTEEDGAFVVKFRGAGQGPKALIAEALVACLASVLGLPVPRPALVELDEGFGRSEPDPEIQDVLRGSVGTNFGLAYLSGALAFDPAVDGPNVSESLAADIVWFDAYVTNVDRTPRNTNLLIWDSGVWMIDHGAALYMQHRWAGWEQKIQSPFPQISDHVLLGIAGDLAAADQRLRPRLDDDTIRDVVAAVPDEWLSDEPEFPDLAAQREAYVRYLTERLNGPRAWLQTAIAARRNGPAKLSVRQTHRVV
ncbi:MAG: aminotransferase class I and II [Chloroflexi bacterium]|nr:aminotransferase class I and II [Chloroflexota bacterium]